MSMQVYVNGEITINDNKGLVEAIQKNTADITLISSKTASKKSSIKKPVSN